MRNIVFFLEAERSEGDLVSALELEDFAGFARARDREAKPLYDLAGGAYLLGAARGELARARPERVLKPDADIATDRGGHRCDGKLVATGAEHRPFVLIAEQTIGGALHVHDVLGVRADPAQDAKDG